MDKFLDKLKKGVSIAVDEAGKLSKVVAGKTSNIVDATKLNIALSDTEKKITKLYAAIGEAVYNDYSDGEDVSEKFIDLCVQIENFKTEIDAIRAQLADLKASVVCPSCNSVNEKSNEYCSKCGAKLSDDAEEDMVIEVTSFEEE